MTTDPVAARAEMVAELEGSGALRKGPVRDALLALPREVLIPQAYVRRSAPGEQMPRWDLLDWAAPGDREELLAVLYGGGSVLIQHDGESILGRRRGARSAGSITSMSTVMRVTASLLQELELRSGQRVLDVGTGAGVTAAVAFCDAPLDEAVERLVRHLREVRPDIVVTHDAYGGLSGHPDHVHAHRVTLLAVQAAGLEHRYLAAGEPWQPSALYLATHPHSGVAELGGLMTRVGKSVLSVPDEWVTATVDVRPWLEQKWSAIQAHRSEVARERALPGILSRLSAEARRRILATEHYTRLEVAPTGRGLERLTT
ncbi:PIG-L family deacetylase [Streptomyces sp. NPDC004008]